MALQVLVKAGSITNLSDARYCAGMGVEIIGFPVGKTNPLALESTKIKEMTGWLSGIKVALELDKSGFDENYTLELIETLHPDYLQIPIALVENYKKIAEVPLLLVTDSTELKSTNGEDIFLYEGNIIHNEKKLAAFCAENNVILSGSQIDTSSIKSILEEIKPFGLELKGGTEISPGLKSFDDLSEIFELLEIGE